MIKRRTLGKRRRRNTQYTRGKNKRKYVRNRNAGRRYTNPNVQLRTYLQTTIPTAWDVDVIREYVEIGADIRSSMPGWGITIYDYILMLQTAEPNSIAILSYIRNLPREPELIFD